MVTTVDVPEDLYQELEQDAAKERKTVPELILALIRIQYPTAEYTADGRLVPPILRTGEPGSMNLTNEEIREIISSGH